MLDPRLHEEAAAAAAASKGSQRGAGSSSSGEPSFSDGLVQDSLTMLEMLHAAKALGEGPLQLALQVYLVKEAGVALPLSSRPGGKLRVEDIRGVLAQLETRQQLDIRSFLLQVGWMVGGHSVLRCAVVAVSERDLGCVASHQFEQTQQGRGLTAHTTFNA